MGCRTTGQVGIVDGDSWEFSITSQQCCINRSLITRFEAIWLCFGIPILTPKSTIKSWISALFKKKASFKKLKLKKKNLPTGHALLPQCAMVNLDEVPRE
jgi:hypothetical protein